MPRHTPARPVDVESLFPELLPFRRESVRLHPRPGSPTFRDSSVGGPLMWPADEPWPVCTAEHYDPDTTSRLEPAAPMAPIVQVRRVDVPGLSFPEGADLLQVLWCPYAHGTYCYPLPLVYWRDSRAIREAGPTPAPAAAGLPDGWYPAPCVVHPERVTEYPRNDLSRDLEEALEDRFEALLAETGLRYSSHLADAPGIKLGGYPGWRQEPCWPDCETCGGRMEHLLTVTEGEFDNESWRTWLPEEDRAAEETETRWLWESEAFNPTLLDTCGVNVYVFECRTCPHRPIGHWSDR
ncbi:DUF1963 domain-containing protein [Streptomyces sp. NBC_01233]|uniref:DUF1963 domain-containing protein n=1 Tax=Streptomyces sp. NBC_01233 TaxID=2903787 RepID=UPI002E1151FB|nr:DUF1963 domain-containing protein [Streptomyces sp. NBC_01233]